MRIFAYILVIGFCVAGVAHAANTLSLYDGRWNNIEDISVPVSSGITGVCYDGRNFWITGFRFGDKISAFWMNNSGVLNYDGTSYSLKSLISASVIATGGIECDDMYLYVAYTLDLGGGSYSERIAVLTYGGQLIDDNCCGAAYTHGTAGSLRYDLALNDLRLWATYDNGSGGARIAQHDIAKGQLLNSTNPGTLATCLTTRDHDFWAVRTSGVADTGDALSYYGNYLDSGVTLPIFPCHGIESWEDFIVLIYQ